MAPEVVFPVIFLAVAIVFVLTCIWGLRPFECLDEIERKARSQKHHDRYVEWVTSEHKRDMEFWQRMNKAHRDAERMAREHKDSMANDLVRGG